MINTAQQLNLIKNEKNQKYIQKMINFQFFLNCLLQKKLILIPGTNFLGIQFKQDQLINNVFK